MTTGKVSSTGTIGESGVTTGVSGESKDMLTTCNSDKKTSQWHSNTLNTDMMTTVTGEESRNVTYQVSIPMVSRPDTKK